MDSPELAKRIQGLKNDATQLRDEIYDNQVRLQNLEDLIEYLEKEKEHELNSQARNANGTD